MRGKRDQVCATEWAGPVAAALGPGWTVRAGALDGDVDAYLVSPDGLELRVQTGGHRRPGRVVVTAVLGELDHHVPSALRMLAPPPITLSPSRRPGDAAAEITGRMLPDAHAVWAAAVAGKRAADAATARQVILAERLADALGLDEDARSEDFVNEHGVRFWWGSRLYEFRLPGVSIELHSLSPERALELAELIGRWAARGED